MSENLDNVIPVDFGNQPTKNFAKSIDQEITIEMLDNMLGKIVHVTENEHFAPVGDEMKAVNVWFAGTVAGYDRRVNIYNEINDTFYSEPQISYHLLLTDGVGYILSQTKCEILELTKEEFLKMVEEQHKKESIKNSILLPGKDFNI